MGTVPTTSDVLLRGARLVDGDAPVDVLPGGARPLDADGPSTSCSATVGSRPSDPGSPLTSPRSGSTAGG